MSFAAIRSKINVVCINMHAAERNGKLYLLNNKDK